MVFAGSAEGDPGGSAQAADGELMNLSGASVLLGLVVVAATDWRVAVGMAAIGVAIWWWARN